MKCDLDGKKKHKAKQRNKKTIIKMAKKKKNTSKPDGNVDGCVCVCVKERGERSLIK